MAYFNYIAMGLICVFILIAALVKKRRPLSERFDRLIESRRFEIVFISVLLIVGAALRLIGLSEVPAGMNQDEASIGYDSWAIANYGVDRNGYHIPIGKPLKLSPAFPPVSTVHATFTAHGALS